MDNNFLSLPLPNAVKYELNGSTFMAIGEPANRFATAFGIAAGVTFGATCAILVVNALIPESSGK